ncbi:hypothetical protein PG994_014824 [Apiospora phragmitis]|uniref:Uncharacterized protein n=1 Tax=Apiospora phragmitis TaxID=2905665 RepID=A0ABR1SUQ0_9PEZI
MTARHTNPRGRNEVKTLMPRRDTTIHTKNPKATGTKSLPSRGTRCWARSASGIGPPSTASRGPGAPDANVAQRVAEHPLDGELDVVLPAERPDPLAFALRLVARDGAVRRLQPAIVLEVPHGPPREALHALEERVLVQGPQQAPVEMAFGVLAQTQGDFGVVAGVLVDPAPVGRVEGCPAPLKGRRARLRILMARGKACATL